MKKIHIAISILAAIAIISCRPKPQTDYLRRLKQVEGQMIQGHSVEAEVDKKILQAVRQLSATLHLRSDNYHWKKYRRKKYKLGFLEISDAYRTRVAMLHKYVTEKALTFTFLQPNIAKNFDIGERFLLQEIKKVRDEACVNVEECFYPTIDLKLAKWLGERYNVDIIETGVITESPDFLDINLRLIETKGPRVIAVGSAKIEKTQLIEKWLCEIGTVCW